MMKTCVILFMMVFSYSIMAQELNKVVTDPDNSKQMLIGYCNRDGLKAGPFAKFYSDGYNAYTPDENIVKQLKKKKGDVEIGIVMGSWCGDSQDQVPRFYKILDELKIEDTRVHLICVDRKKVADGIDVVGMNIQRVPTFIFYRKGNEIGRIIETPMSTLEKDMLMIVSQE